MWPEWTATEEVSRFGALEFSYDPWLLLLSCSIAILASYVAFHHTERLNSAGTGRSKAMWLVTSAMSMGSGIWSMHFVGMLAVRFSTEMHQGYDPWLTGLSFVFAVVGSAIAFYLINARRRERTAPIKAGVVLALGIGAMCTTPACRACRCRPGWSMIRSCSRFRSLRLCYYRRLQYAFC